MLTTSNVFNRIDWSEGKIISTGSDGYREIYQYNKENGNIECVWSVINGVVRCFCQSKYDKNNRLSDIYVNTYVADSIENESLLYTKLRYSYDYNDRGNVNTTKISSGNILLDHLGVRKGEDWERLGTLIFNYDVNDRVEMTELNLFSPPDGSRHSEQRSERNYKESRQFNNLGKLTDCRYSGDLSLTNNMGRILSGQSYQYNENGLVIRSIRRFSSGVSDIIRYCYNDKSLCLSSLTHCPVNMGWPETEKYTWNKDGQLISRLRPDGYKEEYEYDGKPNITRMTIINPEGGRTIKTFLYDSHGHQVIQTIQFPSEYPGGPAVYRQINDTYNNDHLMTRKIFNQVVTDTSAVPEETHFYHWFQNQVIAVSVQNNSGNIKTHFNFNHPDGTAICRFSPITQSQNLKSGVFNYSFRMQWIAQDQQGLFYQPEIIELQQACFEMNLTPPKV
ncbi:TPA: hypothetical protein OT801_000715 [Morganella morganii]|uniref:hypothetical protein n=1 Tax=Morganella morganii TaxID=582 RepID=UPI000911F596|nr:hypothetical protein [Morganella morganii]SGC72201.1 Uncharacterised protein [Mycobacterium tuberculosis]ELA7728048.1 hypothetical protein [Morganella morganii]EME4039702.1 hypothetical protein [Morganella morganii]MBC3998764.1 hypothetical protein [Morganella morganii]MBT0313603.1 hypothetical protein [Morganella morganii subsp. morganii]